MTHESRFSMAAFQNADKPFQPAYAWIWNDQIESAELRRRLDGLRRAGIRTVYVLPSRRISGRSGFARSSSRTT